jgi:hypothetical protein
MLTTRTVFATKLPEIVTHALPINSISRIITVLAACLLPSFAVVAQPMQLPGASIPAPVGTTAAPPPGTSAPIAKPKAPAVVKVPTEDNLAGLVLKRHGSGGEARFEKRGTGYGLKLTVDGFQIANLTEPCAVSFGDQAIPLKSLGKPAGVSRFQLEASICPIVFDVLDGAFLVVEPAAPCMIEAAACRVDPRGLWGPDARTLVSQQREIERARGSAERAVREGYRSLSARVTGPDQRMVAREQAGFSSEREQVCRDFVRESSHGFCAARLTEARAADIRARLGTASAGKAKPKS